MNIQDNYLKNKKNVFFSQNKDIQRVNENTVILETIPEDIPESLNIRQNHRSNKCNDNQQKIKYLFRELSAL